MPFYASCRRPACTPEGDGRRGVLGGGIVVRL